MFLGDKCKLTDFRRSGAVEAHAGNVDPLVLATKMANSINQSKMLQDTYLPKRDDSQDRRRSAKARPQDAQEERIVRKSCNSPAGKVTTRGPEVASL
jgi:hypothetical protein